MDCNPPGSSVHGISQAEYWSGLPFPPPRDLPNPGIKLASPALQADSLLLNHQGRPFYTVVIVKACPLQLTFLNLSCCFFFFFFLRDIFIYFEQKLKSRRGPQNHPLRQLHPFDPPFLEARKSLCIII